MQYKWVQEECAHSFIDYRKKTVFANHTKTGAVTAQLMGATKIEEKLRLLPSIVLKHPVLPPNYTFSLRGSIMIFLHVCVKIGAGQLCVNRSARTADQRFCCRFTGSTLPFNEISYI